jgi:hypothetical protein
VTKTKTALAKLTFFCLSLFVISLMLAFQSFAKVEFESAVAIWLFDEGNGDELKDFTGNGNDGKLMNGPKWVDGKFGKALSFDGQDDYVEINNPVNIVDPDFTIGFLVKPGKTQKMYADILSNHGGGAGLVGYCFEQFENNVNQFYNTFGVGGDFLEQKVALTQLTADVWQHFVSVRDGTTLTHYVDGNETASGNTPKGPVTESPKNLWLGNWSVESGREFNGVIDELFIFNAALSIDDIKNIMDKGILGVAAVYPSGRLASSWANIKAQY